MPDLEDTPVEGELDTSAEAAQGASETEAPPWGDDFKPEQAWRTITTQREAEKELKERLRRIEEDEETRAELLRKWGYEVTDDEDVSGEEDFEFEDDDQLAPVTAKLGELEQWKADQETKEMAAQIREDLTGIHGESEWDLDDEDRQDIVSRAARDPKGFNRDALERAHKYYIDRWERAATQGVERAKKPRPKPSHVTAAGKAATDTKNIVDMTPDEHRAWARERFKERAQGGTST